MEAGTFLGSVSGTYLNAQVVSHWEGREFDYPPELRYSILYLLPSGSFAWFDYWSGFHYGRHAGQFTRCGATLTLRGQDSLMCDVPDQNYTQKSFQREVTLHQRDRKQLLIGLSNKDHEFIGSRIYIPFDGLGSRLFPETWDELQPWIDAFLKRGNDKLRPNGEGPP